MKNNLTQYLGYAIGEIILVVVGILIALMINSWWQDRQDRKYELLMLQELAASVDDEIENVEALNRRADRREAAIGHVLESIHNGYEDNDSSLYRSFVLSSYGNLFSYDPSIYESLKLKGLEKIQNDSIRKKIITLYELQLPRVREFVNSYFGSVEEQDASEFVKSLISYESVKNEDGAYVVQVTPNEDFLKNQNLLKLMHLYIEDVEYYRFRAEGIRRHLSNTAALLESEIQRLESN